MQSQLRSFLTSTMGLRHVYVMSFGATMTDAQFLELVHTMKPGAALVMEDADTLVVNRQDKQGMSFSTMLNVLDGPLRPHGLVCFMTTNHIGRIDDILHVDHMSRADAAAMASHFHFECDNEDGREWFDVMTWLQQQPGLPSAYPLATLALSEQE